MQKKQFPRERNGASLTPVASTLSFTLDTAVVVIDKMTISWNCYFQSASSALISGKVSSQIGEITSAP